MVPALLAVLLAGCGDGSSDLAAGDAATEEDTQDDVAEPAEEEPDSDAPNPSDPDGVEAPSEADEPDGNGSDQLLSDEDDADASAEGTETDDRTVDKVVALPHVWHYGGDAAISGTLRADPDMDGGCFWLEDANRNGELTGLAALFSRRDGERHEEPHFWARFYDDGSPAELVFTEDQGDEGAGEVIAREGDEIEVGGGWWEIARLEVEDLRCQLDEEVGLVDLYDLDVLDGS